jgi:4-amino-4-deoxy-L-arabinose transferase-like glycosyltransferase
MVESPVRTLSKTEGLIAFAGALTLVVVLQLLGGAYASGFGGYPDEPAHLITSLMVRDFIANFDFHNPWQFAQQYYLHYPKVAIGHWPPLFYAALGIWFLIIGASRVSALMFIALVAAATTTIIYFTGKHLIGRWAGIFASVLFAASPLVQESSARVMTEHAASLGMLVSTLCFARFANTGRIRVGLAFGTISAAAILTHGDAWALGLVPGLTLALTNRWYLLRRPGLWLAAVPVLVACVPWYVFTLDMSEGSWAGDVTSFWVQAVPAFGSSILMAVGLPLVIFALIGAWNTTIRIKPRVRVSPDWAALAGLVVATFVFHCIAPAGLDPRYMVPLLPSIVLFSAAGVDHIACRFGTRLSSRCVRVVLSVALIVAFSVDSFALPLRLRNGGYAGLAAGVKARLANVPQVWLISSDSTGEGCLVAAVALQDRRRPGNYVLLGKKILAGGDWLGRNTQDRFDTPAKLKTLLDEIPVTVIVIDDRISPNSRLPYQDRLRKLVTSDTTKWAPIGSYAETRGGVVFANSLHVYARRPVAALTTTPPKVQHALLISLIGIKELRQPTPPLDH